MAKTLTYTVQNEGITIYGFIAFLLRQGQDWDYRCVEADMLDYHQQHYARMDKKEALLQEIQWWLNAYHTEVIHTHPEKENLLSEGICYLFDCASKLLSPDSDTDKLTANMSIFLDEDNYLYKHNDDLGIFPTDGTLDCIQIIHGFPAQLLTYAACTTIDTMIDKQDIDDPVEWVYMMKHWLQSPYLSEKQRKAYERYLTECQQYLADHSQSRSKGRSYSFNSYWCPDTADYIQQAAIRKLKAAVKKEHPAAALALTVKQLQRDGIFNSELRPLTHFVDVVNKVCNCDVKYDSFAKHFR